MPSAISALATQQPPVLVSSLRRPRPTWALGGCLPHPPRWASLSLCCPRPAMCTQAGPGSSRMKKALTHKCPLRASESSLSKLLSWNLFCCPQLSVSNREAQGWGGGGGGYRTSLPWEQLPSSAGSHMDQIWVQHSLPGKIEALRKLERNRKRLLLSHSESPRET